MRATLDCPSQGQFVFPGGHAQRRSAVPLIAGCVAVVLVGTGCRAPQEQACDLGAQPGHLVFNEIVSSNDGVAIDSIGATADFIEIENVWNESTNLGLYSIEHKGGQARLPAFTLPPRGRILLWANDRAAEGPENLPFKISSAGETLTLTTCGDVIDRAAVPSLAPNDAFARHPDGRGALEVCRYATPERDNGDKCAPPEPTGLVSDERYEDFQWPGPHPPVPEPLAFSEASLFPAEFVEVENTGTEVLNLADFRLSLAKIRPGEVLPGPGEGSEIQLGEASLNPGELFVVSVDDAHIAEIDEDPAFEGVLSLFDANGEAVDRWDFMHWPAGATLTRSERESGHASFCEESTPGEENTCTPVQARPVGSRVRGLRTVGDFAALAEGGSTLGTSSVKFVVDVKQGKRVHLLRGEDWALHYTFIREVIEGKEPLDRCDPIQRDAFNQGWYDFSVTEYFTPSDRSYFLGTLVKHGSSGHQTVEFALGDTIRADDIAQTFFRVTAKVPDAKKWAYRPQDDAQNERARIIEGELPIVATNAPFENLQYQPLTHGEGYGVLTWVPARELESTPLGAQVILVTDDVPNDIPLVGGLITQAFQTPLAHVNVLSQNRGTPNMAHRHAETDPRIVDHLGKLVRLVVEGDDFFIEEADPDDAEEFWDEHRPSGPLQSPRLDTSVRNLVDLDEASLENLPQIGAKAAQMGELFRVRHVGPSICQGLLDYEVPRGAFAVPVVHFLEHFERSGAQARLEQLQQDSDFRADPLFRAERLRDLQQMILEHPVDEELLGAITAQVRTRFVNEPARFRSSSNAEDLPGFNGAGLYTSVSVELDDPERRVDDGLRTVWASLFNPRAYDERELARVEHSQVAMGVLVHEAFPFEAANGVGVSRNLLDPTRGDIYYLNAQAGEASVTNPAPGVSTESLEFQWPSRTPLLTYQSQSSLTHGDYVLSEEENVRVACALYGIHHHFRPILDPEKEDPWFAMEIEFKYLQPTRHLVVKQARPHTFGGFDIAGDCREL